MKRVNDIDILINGLSDTPVILQNFLNDIPEDVCKIRRIQSKWSIHEHVCHLAQAETMIYNRFREFNKKIVPSFNAYLPESTHTGNDLLHLDLKQQLKEFKNNRSKAIVMLKNFSPDIWFRKAIHEEYKEYSSYILLRHVLMHDYFHMYRIEELWLTKSEYLKD